MSWSIYVDVAVGFLMSVVVLVMAIMSGREEALHRALWLLGVVLLTLRALLSAAIGVGVMGASGGMWAFTLGAVALLLLIPTAYLRPRWAGIVLLISAVLQPLILVGLRPLAGERDEFPVEVMLGFYSVPAVVIGGVLIASTMSWGKSRADRPTSIAPTSERVKGS